MLLSLSCIALAALDSPASASEYWDYRSAPPHPAPSSLLYPRHSGPTDRLARVSLGPTGGLPFFFWYWGSNSRSCTWEASSELNPWPKGSAFLKSQVHGLQAVRPWAGPLSAQFPPSGHSRRWLEDSGWALTGGAVVVEGCSSSPGRMRQEGHKFRCSQAT